jgi:hypothetical protein
MAELALSALKLLKHRHGLLHAEVPSNILFLGIDFS